MSISQKIFQSLGKLFNLGPIRQNSLICEFCSIALAAFNDALRKFTILGKH